jgi:hypothetical protein
MLFKPLHRKHVRSAVLLTVSALLLMSVGPVYAAPGPGNDTYAGRSVISSLPFSDSVNTTKATTDANDTETDATSACGPTPTDASVWYEFTPTSDASVVIDASTSTYPVGVIVATGSPGSFSFVACGFFFGGSTPKPFATGGPLLFSAISGETYAILAFDPQFDGGGNGGTLNISVQVAPPPPVVHLTVNGSGTFNKVTGSATISGTVTCTGQADFGFIDSQLTQTVGRFTISGFGETDFVCDGTTQAWSMQVFPFGGLFKGGQTASDTVAQACGPFECSFDEVIRSIRLR